MGSLLSLRQPRTYFNNPYSSLKFLRFPPGPEVGKQQGSLGSNGGGWGKLQAVAMTGTGGLKETRQIVVSCSSMCQDFRKIG